MISFNCSSRQERRRRPGHGNESLSSEELLIAFRAGTKSIRAIDMVKTANSICRTVFRFCNILAIFALVIYQALPTSAQELRAEVVPQLGHTGGVSA
jgi:hypothetical protein